MMGSIPRTGVLPCIPIDSHTRIQKNEFVINSMMAQWGPDQPQQLASGKSSDPINNGFQHRAQTTTGHRHALPYSGPGYSGASSLREAVYNPWQNSSASSGTPVRKACSRRQRQRSLFVARVSDKSLSRGKDLENSCSGRTSEKLLIKVAETF